MLKRCTVMTALLAALLFLISSSAAAQDKSGGGSSKGGFGSSGGSDGMSSRGVGDPRERPGGISDRPFMDPAGSRVKDPGLFERSSSADRVFDPAGNRTKDPALSDRVYDPSGSRANIPSDRELARFTGIAKSLNTTTAGLAQSYEKAYKVDDNLSFSEFVTANMIAAQMGSKYPKVTAGNILLGYQRTKSLGKILKSLGMAPAEASTVENLTAQQMAWARLIR